MSELTFLGTGNFLAHPGRYWNAFGLDGNVLVEPAPTALPNLRKCGFAVEAIDVVGDPLLVASLLSLADTT